MKKIDVHIHCATTRRATKGGNPKRPETHYVADPEEMMQALRAKGIEKAILMSSGEASQADNGFPMLGNRECIRICEEHPDFFAWMCNLDPGDPAKVEEKLAEYKAQGAVGIGELMINQWMDSPFLTAVFQAAEKLELPVTMHFSPEPGVSYGVCDRAGLPLLEKTLRQYPALKLLGHSQVFWLEISADCPKEGNAERSGFGRGPVVPGGRVEQLFEQYPNLYGDLSAFSAYCAITRDEAYGLAFLHRFADRLLFATDATNALTIPPLLDKLEEWYLAGKLSEDDYQNICYKNAQKIYAL